MAGFSAVFGNLCFEGFDVRKPHFIAKTLHEFYLHLASVDVLIEVQEVDFEDAFGMVLGDGGAVAKVGHGREKFGAEACGDGIDSNRGKLLGLSGEVGRRETDFSADLSPFNYVA